MVALYLILELQICSRKCSLYSYLRQDVQVVPAEQIVEAGMDFFHDFTLGLHEIWSVCVHERKRAEQAAASAIPLRTFVRPSTAARSLQLRSNAGDGHSGRDRDGRSA